MNVIAETNNNRIRIFQQTCRTGTVGFRGSGLVVGGETKEEAILGPFRTVTIIADFASDADNKPAGVLFSASETAS